MGWGGWVVVDGWLNKRGCREQVFKHVTQVCALNSKEAWLLCNK